MKAKYLVAIFLALFASLQGQTFDPAKLDAFLDRLGEKNQAMGSLTIAQDGKIIYAHSMGFALIDGTQKKPLDAATRFKIGSIAKMYTAAMIYQLAEENKLKLTDTLSTYFPQIQNAQTITLSQILGHRSGIHDSLLDPNLRTTPRTEPITREEVLALIAKGTPDFEPGSQHRYSNSGYAVLGLILEKITGQSYGEALRERITSRIGLSDTYAVTEKTDVSKNEAVGYARFPDGFRPSQEMHPSNQIGGGAIVATTADMAKFIQALFDGKIISQEHLAVMKTQRDGEGMGMVTFQFAGKTFYGENGGGGPVGAWVAYLPEERLAIAYATNAKIYPVSDIMNGIVDLYCGRPFQIPSFEAVTVAPEILESYCGVYAIEGRPMKFTITREGGTLFAQPARGGRSQMEPMTQNKFLVTTNVTVEFNPEKSQMVLNRAGTEIVFTKEK